MVMKETLSYYAANKGNVYCILYLMPPRRSIQLIIIDCFAVLLTENCHQLF